jgi:hypothetical protein
MLSLAGVALAFSSVFRLGRDEQVAALAVP